MTSLDPIVHCSVEHIYPSSTRSSPQQVGTLKDEHRKKNGTLRFFETNVTMSCLSAYMYI